jgi:hypothetical protein
MLCLVGTPYHPMETGWEYRFHTSENFQVNEIEVFEITHSTALRSNLSLLGPRKSKIGQIEIKARIAE